MKLCMTRITIIWLFLLVRNHRIMDEKIESTSDRLERLESELRQREREMDDSTHQKSLMQKDITSLKQNIKGTSFYSAVIVCPE